MRILNEAETFFSLRCLAFIFGHSCHHKVHWAQVLIDSCGRGTRHVVGRLRACEVVPLRHVLQLISNGFKNSNARPYITVPLVHNITFCMHYENIMAGPHFTAIYGPSCSNAISILKL